MHHRIEQPDDRGDDSVFRDPSDPRSVREVQLSVAKGDPAQADCGARRRAAVCRWIVGRSGNGRDPYSLGRER